MINLKLLPARKKPNSVNKTVYLPQAFIERINAIAAANDTSFNHVVASMIAACIEEEDKPNPSP